jgi:hypothetical protein
MGSPRVDVVFRLWQCDKENHGWREGPPVTVLCQSFRSAGRAFTLRQRQFRTKKEYSFTWLIVRPLLRTLAGLKRLRDQIRTGLPGLLFGYGR